MTPTSELTGTLKRCSDFLFISVFRKTPFIMVSLSIVYRVRSSTPQSWEDFDSFVIKVSLFSCHETLRWFIEDRLYKNILVK